MEVSNTTLSLNYIFVRSTIPTVVRSASAIVHRNYNLDIAYEMSLANNSAYWKPNFYIKKLMASNSQKRDEHSFTVDILSLPTVNYSLRFVNYNRIYGRQIHKNRLNIW